MSLIVSAYTREAFKEFMLPSVNNADHIITLMKDDFVLKEDVHLHLEVMDNIWRLKAAPEYKIIEDNRSCQDKELNANTILRINTGNDENLSLIVSDIRQPFHDMKKYTLEGVSEIRIGKEEGNDIVYNALGIVSRKHAKIYKVENGFEIENLSPNGIYINSFRINGRAKLKFGDFINIVGLHLVFLGNRLAADTSNAFVKINSKVLREQTGYSDETAVMTSQPAKASGKTIYHRAPRYFEPTEKEEIEIEPPPQLNKQKKQSFMMLIGPSVTMALPMLLGCLLMIYAYGDSMQGRASLFMYSGLVMAVSSALVGVIWAIANMREQKKEEREAEERRLKKYGDYLIEKAGEIKKVYEATLQGMLDNYPHPDRCFEYSEKNNLLWNRNRSHKDFLTHRLGKGDIPFPTEIKTAQKRFSLEEDPLADKAGRIKEEYGMLYGAPAVIDLLKHRLIGIIGGDNKEGAIEISQTLSAQIAMNNCYTDVKLAYIYNDSSSSDRGHWEFAKWLPHVWSEDRKTRFLASDKEQASDVFYELTNVFRDRLEQNENSSSKNVQIPKPYYIVFISDPTLLEGELFAKYVMEQSDAAGLTTVILAESFEDLPNNCDYIIENTDNFKGYYGVSDSRKARQEIDFDKVDEQHFEKKARSMSRLKVQELEEGGELPNSITFFEMMGVNHPSELPVKELWAKNRIYDNIRGQIGEKAGGAPCYLDVHEKYHGPHGLVAGTTGSGKSETLQTYMLSLAVNYSPDDIGFFVIDYKGGGMANLFDGLPHMVGQISNLSGNQVKRAMISIKSENRRRQRIFNENGVNNINNYTKLFKNGEAEIPIPHLFIVIDEFAELKREEPDFMRELISVAQVGRSLGVHLILATQKPSGTVDDNIWSNSKFRLCLRVQDRQDSNDMLHKPDAAYITQAGRCYLQVGNDEIYELFQSGYSGAPYDENAASASTDIAKLITLNGKVDIRGSALKAMAKKTSKGDEKTELDAVKEHLIKLAAEGDFKYKHQLWLPVLRSKIYLDEFSEFADYRFTKEAGWKDLSGKEWNLRFPVGQIDDPANQSQLPYELDFAENGNIAICGSIVSGKSTSMQSIAYALINKYTPEMINLYALDFSSKLMSAFEKAPQFGGVMYENDGEKIGKFFNMIQAILNERKVLFRGGNYKQYVKVNGVKLPAIIIFVDNYAAFKEKTGEQYDEIMIRLSKEGISHGIFLVVSGGGFGMNDITTRLAENLGTVLTLSLPDKFAYGDLLHTMQIDVLPETGVKGRGLVQFSDNVLEYQTALAVAAENDYERMEKIKEVCGDMAAVWKGRTARPVPEIPAKPEWSIFSEQEDYAIAQQSRKLLPVGYDEANAQVFSLPLQSLYCYGVYGTRQSGKKNFIKACIMSAIDKNAEICIMDRIDGEFGLFEGSDGVTYCCDEQSIFDYLSGLLPIFKDRNVRKNELLNEGIDNDELAETMISETEPIFIVVPDMTWMIPLVYDSEMEMKGFLENILEKGRFHNIYFIGGLDLERKSEVAGYKMYEYFSGYRTGIHFGGKPIDNSILNFDYLSYAQQSKTEKPGLGLLPQPENENDPVRVVIPLVKLRKRR